MFCKELQGNEIEWVSIITLGFDVRKLGLPTSRSQNRGLKL